MEKVSDGAGKAADMGLSLAAEWRELFRLATARVNGGKMQTKLHIQNQLLGVLHHSREAYVVYMQHLLPLSFPHIDVELNRNTKAKKGMKTWSIVFK